ncbi:hypothetical protein BC830DRAFT_1167890 [Chytriomyces sp. MP71]|nr:hypothetical protein BC830DRAFT_1167890 [Chytriomyces sp. MP71]
MSSITRPPVPTRFANLARARPDLTIAQIINSGNFSAKEIEDGAVDLNAFPAIPEKADAVVCGAGIAGLMYAITLKTTMPSASVVVLEQATEPKYKIGESTLSPFSRFSNSFVLPVPYMLRLFGLKEGLDFVLVDPNEKDTHPFDIGGFDYSFQIERKVSELLFTLKAQRLGVKVFYGVGVESTSTDPTTNLQTITYSYAAAVSPKLAKTKPVGVGRIDSPIKPNIPVPNNTNPLAAFLSNLKKHSPANGDAGKRTSFMNTPPKLSDRSRTLPAKYVRNMQQPHEENKNSRRVVSRVLADGSGLAKMVSQGRSKTERFEGINVSAFWAYFEEDMSIPEDRVANWTTAFGTQHICYQEGWSWWIRLLSWENSPRSNLMDLMTFLLDQHDAGVSGEDLPAIQPLAETFGCAVNRIVSIGMAVRDDTLNTFEKMACSVHDPEGPKNTFWGIVHKHPVLKGVLCDSGRYKLLRDYYGKARGTYMARASISYRQTEVAGPGWFLMGNAAGFTSPFVSPGINALALPLAFYSANLTAELLSGKKESVWVEFQEFVTKQHLKRLRDFDVMCYHMFRHPDLFNNVFHLYFANAMGNIELWSENYSSNEIGWAVGCGVDSFPALIAEILPLVCGPAHEAPSPDTVAALVELRERTRARLHAENPNVPYSMHMRNYSDALQFVPGKNERTPGEFIGLRCDKCLHASPCNKGGMCLMCGKKFEEEIVASVVQNVGVEAL